jgi:hypothetical protein
VLQLLSTDDELRFLVRTSVHSISLKQSNKGLEPNVVDKITTRQYSKAGYTERSLILSSCANLSYLFSFVTYLLCDVHMFQETFQEQTWKEQTANTNTTLRHLNKDQATNTKQQALVHRHVCVLVCGHRHVNHLANDSQGDTVVEMYQFTNELILVWNNRAYDLLRAFIPQHSKIK